MNSMPWMRPSAIETDIVVDQEIMALAGHDHVVVAVEAELAGPARLHGGERRNRRPLGGLRLLAAEAAAHAANFDRHRMIGAAEHMGDNVLDLGGMLGRAIDDDVAILPGKGQRDLALEIEMILAAHLDAALQAMRGGLQRRG